MSRTMPDEDRERRAIVRAWCLYDWASSAFVTSVVVVLLPPFFRSLAERAGMASTNATAAWGYATALGMLVIALLAPWIGAAADNQGMWKRPFLRFLALGALATFALAGVPSHGWLLAMLVFLIADLGFAGANVLYESLLPRIAPPGEIDRISVRGYALGYVGGGLLLVLHLAWVSWPAAFGLPGQDFAVRLAFASVAVWWVLFTVPLVRRLPETRGADTKRRREVDRGGVNERVAAWLAPWRRLHQTLREIRRYRQLTLFLAAFWLYNDGIGTIIKMATAYGDEIGIGLRDMMIALVITQFVGVPCALLFGRLAEWFGAKRSVLLGLCIYLLIAIGALFMRRPVHFYMLAVGVGLVQGGTQALSRSLFARLVPRDRTGEFFGLFSTSARLAGIAGPFAFALVSQAAGSSRLGILIIIVFFVTGGLLLTSVRFDEPPSAGGAASHAASASASRLYKR
jgi:UMF1 family MFS transporter